jgi:hypothetical protein
MNDPRPPNHSASIARSGIADAPKRLVPMPSALTGFATTLAVASACCCEYVGICETQSPDLRASWIGGELVHAGAELGRAVGELRGSVGELRGARRQSGGAGGGLADAAGELAEAGLQRLRPPASWFTPFTASGTASFFRPFAYPAA